MAELHATTLWSRSSYDISSYDVMVHLSGGGSYIYPIHASVINGVAFEGKVWSRSSIVGGSHDLWVSWSEGNTHDHYANDISGVAIDCIIWSRSFFYGWSCSLKGISNRGNPEDYGNWPTAEHWRGVAVLFLSLVEECH